MPTIQRFYNRTVTIRRYNAGSAQRDFSTVTASQETHIQRDTSTPTIDRYGADAAIYTAWMDVDADIKHGDMVVDTDGLVYKVTGVIKQGQDTAINEHKEVFMRQYDK